MITNEELAARPMETSDEWIRTRTGIHERRAGGSTAGLSADAGRQALDGGADPDRIDALILATTTPTSSGAPPHSSRTNSGCGAARSRSTLRALASCTTCRRTA
ncbi:MAG: hypothetical protein R2697_17245 [Ilumatobacteraceae bacterium]